MRVFISSFVLGILYLLSASPIHAAYVLPYPSYMPGNKLYRISRFTDVVKQYWYWGNIASLRYHLSLADKYLVEAKTLFEYKQYLLAADALSRSSAHFEQLPMYLKKAALEKKDITQLKVVLQGATTAHIAILESSLQALPDTFEWQPEKSESTVLPLGRLLRDAIRLRQTVWSIGQIL